MPGGNDVGCTDFFAKASGWNIGSDTYTQLSKMVGKKRAVLFILICALL